MNTQLYELRLKTLKVLVVDDEHYMRKVTRTILTAIGVTKVIEAADGMVGLELARSHDPGLMIIDWEMPRIDWPQLVQMIRDPKEIMLREVPIIMLSAHAEVSRVVESVRFGANEFVRKPVSIKTLHDRIISAISKTRPNVQIGAYYGPMPRRLAPIDTYEATADGTSSPNPM